MAVIVAAGAFLMTLIGGVVAQRIGDRRHLVLGLAAGLMLGVVVFDPLREALSAQPHQIFHVPTALVLMACGFLAIHVVERSVAIHRAHEGEYASHEHAHAVGRRHGHDTPSLGVAAAGALIVHSLLDGFAIGAAFQAGSGLGAVVAVAIIPHDFAAVSTLIPSPGCTGTSDARRSPCWPATPPHRWSVRHSPWLSPSPLGCSA